MKKYTYLFAMVFILALSFICINGVQADTHTWTGSGADNQAATVANWDYMPATGDNVTIGYDARNINWNLPTTITLANVWYNGSVSSTSNMMITESVNTVITGTLAIWSEHATYTVGWSTSVNKLTTGPIVLGTRALLLQTGTAGDVTCTGYLQNGAGSVLTGKVDARFTCSGNFNNNAGTFGASYNAKINLVMSGTGTLTIQNLAETWLQSLKITGNTTSFGTITVYSNDNAGTYLVSGNHIIAGTMVWTKNHVSHMFVNTGAISGSGTLVVSTYIDTNIVSTGTISCKVILRTQGDVGANRSISFGTDFTVNNILTVTSDHPTRTCSVNLNGNRLSASGLVTASTRGIIMSSVSGASIFGPVSTINGGIIDWTNISWNPLPPVINALTITKISGDNGIDEMMHYLAKFRGISNSTITWSLANAPSWMHVFPNNGTIYGLTDVNSQGNNTYELIASNAVGTTTYHGYLWVADTYYGSEEMDTILILMIIFLMFCTIMNICGMLWKIPLLSLVSFAILFAGIFADPQIWDSLPMLPIGIVIINLIIMFLTIVRNRR